MIGRIDISFTTDPSFWECANHFLDDPIPISYGDARQFINQFSKIISLLQKEAVAVSLKIALHISASSQNVVSREKEPAEKELLSKREKEVLRMMFEGLTSKEIAQKLFISFETVKSHRKNILFKTGSKNTAALSQTLSVFDLEETKK